MSDCRAEAVPSAATGRRLARFWREISDERSAKQKSRNGAEDRLAPNK